MEVLIMINASEWKEFKISDLFDCKLSKGDLKESECDEGSINLVSSGTLNNGIVKRIEEAGDGKAEIFTGNCLTLDMFCNCFYQDEKFYSVSHGRVNILIPKFELNRQIGLFIATLLNKEQYRFSYGRAVYNSFAENIVIKLPTTLSGSPDWNYITDFMNEIETRESSSNLRNSIKTSNASKNDKINTDGWKEFSFDELFIIKKGTRLTSDDMEPGNINFIGAIDNDNGVRETIGNGFKYDGNCITVNYNGSVGEAFYQYEPFWASDDVNVLFLRDRLMNKYIGLFLCTLIKKEKFKYSYGRKWNLEQMKKSFLQLPIDKVGKPDWDYMENYVKKLPYADKI